jgi:hypothetical protein
LGYGEIIPRGVVDVDAADPVSRRVVLQSKQQRAGAAIWAPSNRGNQYAQLVVKGRTDALHRKIIRFEFKSSGIVLCRKGKS